MLLTLRQAWDETTKRIGIGHHARWLLEAACGLDATEFSSALDNPMTERAVAHLDAMLGRYEAGEPLQYVLGRWSFRYIDLAIDRRVLIPRPETELVAEVAIELARRFTPRRVVDLGCGSGAIGLSMAVELPLDHTEVWLTDINVDALDVARANLAGIGRRASNVRIAEPGAWFDPLPQESTFDVIVSNPPYVADGDPNLDASVADWEPAVALFAGSDGLDAYRSIIADAQTRLNPGGWIVLEIGADQGELVRALLAAAQFTNIEVRPDLAGCSRIALAKR